MKTNRMLGETRLDKELYNLYIDTNKDVILFWIDYIPKLHLDCCGSKNINLSINQIGLEVYTKMIINILVECKIQSEESYEITSNIKFHWSSPSYDYTLLFRFLVEMLKNDLKDPLFKEILLRKKSDEFRKFTISRLWTLPFDNNANFFSDENIDDDYYEYFCEKDKYWRQNSLDKIKKTQEILIKKLLKAT